MNHEGFIKLEVAVADFFFFFNIFFSDWMEWVDKLTENDKMERG